MDQAQGLRNIIKANQVVSVSETPKARIITVTSGKGGVGKSNVSINLAIQFKKMGQRVIILDADFGLANIEVMFGAIPKYNLYDLIYQGKSVNEIITWGPMEVGFISGGSGIAGMSQLSNDNLMYIIRNLAKLDDLADIIIVDTAAGISDAVLEFLVASGEILLVTTPEPTSITDSYSLLKALTRHPRFSKNSSKIRVIANKVESSGDGRNLYEKFRTVVDKYLDIPMEYLGEIPQDKELGKSVMNQSPVSIEFPAARSTQKFQEMAAVLMNQEVTGVVRRRGMAAFFSHIIGKK